MRICAKYVTFKKYLIMSCKYDFQMHQQHFQRIYYLLPAAVQQFDLISCFTPKFPDTFQYVTSIPRFSVNSY